jgi:hypothetical protein
MFSSTRWCSPHDSYKLSRCYLLNPGHLLIMYLLSTYFCTITSRVIPCREWRQSGDSESWIFVFARSWSKWQPCEKQMKIYSQWQLKCDVHYSDRFCGETRGKQNNRSEPQIRSLSTLPHVVWNSNPVFSILLIIHI